LHPSSVALTLPSMGFPVSWSTCSGRSKGGNLGTAPNIADKLL
jgi:heme A synthase